MGIFYALLVIAGVLIWIFSSISDAISSVKEASQERKNFEDERRQKFPNRVVNTSQSLFERNKDIIYQYADKPTGSLGGYSYYEVDNKIRDCLNEICLAENNIGLRPGSKYLSVWKNNAPREWLELSEQIKKAFSDRKKQLEEIKENERLEALKEIKYIEKIEEKVDIARSNLRRLKQQKKDPLILQNINKRKGQGDICLDEINYILTPNERSWTARENELISFNGEYIEFPLFLSEKKLQSVDSLNKEINHYNSELKNDLVKHSENKAYFQKILEGYKSKIKDDIIQRFDYVLNDIEFPISIPKIWDIDFDPEQQIAIVEISLPDVIHNTIFKRVQQRAGSVLKPLNQKESKENIPNIHPAVILRVAYEIFRNDYLNTIKLLVVNGWVEFIDPTTGTIKKTYAASLAVGKDQIIGLNLIQLNPLLALTNLKGKSAGKLIDIVPVTPIMSLDKKDSRFIETKEVLGNLSAQTNLASMDWQDFENLIAELFQREFTNEGAEVKVTQASRDRGVDAVIFNPDPIKGGKYIVQAKRYTNVVDVSAVRDLCAVVRKEGASRGILITTSTFGRDAYTFAQNEPITLLDGSQLLGLLEKHNYKFKIDLIEARKINAAKVNS